MADDIAKWFGYFTYTVSDVITVCDGRCWTYTMADVIALVQQCGGCWYHLYCWLLSQVWDFLWQMLLPMWQVEKPHVIYLLADVIAIVADGIAT